MKVGPYVYSAAGDERDRVEELLASTKPLDETCVAHATKWH